MGQLSSALVGVVEAGPGSVADPLGPAGLGEDLDGLGVCPGSGLELEPIGRREQVVRLPGQVERDGAEQGFPMWFVKPDVTPGVLAMPLRGRGEVARR